MRLSSFFSFLTHNIRKNYVRWAPFITKNVIKTVSRLEKKLRLRKIRALECAAFLIECRSTIDVVRAQVVWAGLRWNVIDKRE